MSEVELVRVQWFEHDCDWISKYCDEFHTRSVMIPRPVLNNYVALDLKWRTS